MILSGADINQYIKYGGLSFSPELREDQFQQNGIDLILNEVELVRKGVDISFYLGSTREYVQMPNDLMGDVALRSTMARGIMLMPNTKVDAGFHGNITLEIWAWNDVELPIGERFVHFVLHKLASPSEPYSGKYQGQTGITHAK
jgi:deoxycytidine triphosphate deaminase